MLGEDSGVATRGPRFEDERVDCALLIPKPSKLVVEEGDNIVSNRGGKTAALHKAERFNMSPEKLMPRSKTGENGVAFGVAVDVTTDYETVRALLPFVPTWGAAPKRTQKSQYYQLVIFSQYGVLRNFRKNYN
ncbi:hypothetical protein U1Q18_037238 [Sarracenia purpurea var. burkii]